MEGEGNYYRVCEGGEAQRIEAVARCVCLRPGLSGGIYSYEAKWRIPWDVQKVTAINRR